MRDRFLESLLASFGVDPAVRHVAGVTVAASPTRSEGQAAGYAVGDHLVITCNPAIEASLLEAAAGSEPSLAAWQQLADVLGGDLLGAGRQQTVSTDGLRAPDVPAGFSLRSLDAARPSDVALIAELIEVSEPADLDEAEVEIDDLDPIMEVLLDGHERIACYSAARSFELTPEFADIGILTRADCRGLGLGSALVAALCPRIRSSGLEPLYRCDELNAASVALSAGLGFEIAAQLAVYRFPDL